MEYRKLGRTGLKVSELCMGTMQFGWTADERISFDILNAAFEAGINFFDTADIYSRWVEGNPGGVSEEIIGKWIIRFKIPREQIVIATKVRGQMSDDPNDQGLSRQHIQKSVEGSLHRMQTDYIDIYQAHWFDEEISIEESLRAFDELVRQGKVRFIGCSNYPAWRLMEALWTSDKFNLIRYDTLQPHYNLVKRAEFERELSDVCQKYDIGVIPYSPLSGGFLTGKYRKDQEIPKGSRGENSPRLRKYFTDENWELLDLLEGIGERKGGFSISQVALAWHLSNPVITSPIIGPRNMEQLEDNIGAVGLRITNDEMEQLNQASEWEEG
ncbi:MAG: aldo/keto reductase [Anaerolineales bacterium]|nr:MAG: aldo/keto reductase [Anaerolineales bacterium]